jgi:hypothetical protein
MAKGKGKKGKKGLSGVAVTQEKSSYVDTAKEGGLMLLAAIAAGGAGAAIGKHSLIAGIPLTLFGVHKRNKYLIAAGLGLTLSNGFQLKNQPTTTGGIGALDMKQIATEAKDRVTTFFKNFADKLYLPKSTESGTSGLGDDQVTYFVNPYSSKELDMSAIDRIQEQIAEMSKGGASGLSDVDREF